MQRDFESFRCGSRQGGPSRLTGSVRPMWAVSSFVPFAGARDGCLPRLLDTQGTCDWLAGSGRAIRGASRSTGGRMRPAGRMERLASFGGVVPFFSIQSLAHMISAVALGCPPLPHFFALNHFSKERKAPQALLIPLDSKIES